MEEEKLDLIVSQLAKNEKLLKRLSEQKYDENNEIDKRAAFVKNRIFQVRTDSAIPKLSLDPAFFIHVIPEESNLVNVIEYDRRSQVDVLMTTMHPWFEGSYDYLYNYDGFATVNKDEYNNVRSYAQLLRCGVGELYATSFPLNDVANTNAIDGNLFFGMLSIRIGGIIATLQEFNYKSKYDVYISFVDFKNVLFANSRFITFPMAQNDAYFPKVKVDGMQELNNQPQYIKTLNHIAQAFGMSTRHSNR